MQDNQESADSANNEVKNCKQRRGPWDLLGRRNRITKQIMKYQNQPIQTKE